MTDREAQEARNAELAAFYDECAVLLDTTHEGKPFAWPRRTRWSNRHAGPGRGRFPGRGLIRVFGDVVHVALTDPHLTMVGSREEVIERLRAFNLKA